MRKQRARWRHGVAESFDALGQLARKSIAKAHERGLQALELERQLEAANQQLAAMKQMLDFVAHKLFDVKHQNDAFRDYGLPVYWKEVNEMMLDAESQIKGFAELGDELVGILSAHGITQAQVPWLSAEGMAARVENYVDENRKALVASGESRIEPPSYPYPLTDDELLAQIQARCVEICSSTSGR